MSSELLLDGATLLGGLSALWFLFERLLPAGGPLVQEASSQPVSRQSQMGRLWAALRGPTVATPVVLGMQWVIAVFVLFATSPLTGIYAFAGPLWILPLGNTIARFVTRQSALARLAGGLAGGMIGAGVAWPIQPWTTRFGLIFGLFFGALVSGYFVSPRRNTTVISGCISTLLLLLGLGVFEELAFFADPPGNAFIAGGLAVIVALAAASLVHTLHQSPRAPRRTRSRKS